MIRNLVDLLVKKVDLVDVPANQRPFLVVKSKHGSTAAKPEVQMSGKTPAAAAATEQNQSVLPQEVLKALDEAGGLFQGTDALNNTLKEVIAKAVAEATAAAVTPEQAMEGLQKATNILSGLGAVESVGTEVKDAIAKATSLIERAMRRFGPDMVKTRAPKGGMFMAKSADEGQGGDGDDAGAATTTADAQTTPVEKAGARISKKRKEALQMSLKQLQDAAKQIRAVLAEPVNKSADADADEAVQAAQAIVAKAAEIAKAVEAGGEAPEDAPTTEQVAEAVALVEQTELQKAQAVLKQHELKQAKVALEKAQEVIKAHEGGAGAASDDEAGALSEIAKSMTALADSIKTQNERLTNLEGKVTGTVAVSKSAGDGGNTEGDHQGKTKVEKSFWAGVL